MRDDSNAPSVYPTLTYDDPDAAVRFLVDAFGFTEEVVYRDDEGNVAHAELGWGPCMVMVSPKRTGSPFSFGPSGVYVAVDDPDDHHDRAVAAGAEIVMGLEDKDYGSRDYVARDPEGNVWSFGTYRPAPGTAAER